MGVQIIASIMEVNLEFPQKIKNRVTVRSSYYAPEQTQSIPQTTVEIFAHPYLLLLYLWQQENGTNLDVITRWMDNNNLVHTPTGTLKF